MGVGLMTPAERQALDALLRAVLMAANWGQDTGIGADDRHALREALRALEMEQESKS